MTSNSKFSNIQLKIDANKKFRKESEKKNFLQISSKEKKKKSSSTVAIIYSINFHCLLYTHEKEMKKDRYGEYNTVVVDYYSSM